MPEKNLYQQAEVGAAREYEALRANNGYDKALSFISVVNGLKQIDGADDPVGLLKDNPFAEYLVEWAGEFDDADFNFSSIEVGKGMITLKYDPDAKNEARNALVISDKEYLALFWKEIEPTLGAYFASKDETLSPILMREIVKKQPVNFFELIDKLAKNGNNINQVGPELLDAALEELKHIKNELMPELVKQRDLEKKKIETGQAAKAERAELKQKIRPLVLPAEPKMDTADFVKAVDARDKTDELNLLKIQILNEGHEKINADSWSYKDKDAVLKAYQEMAAVGVPVDTPFYAKMFNVLSRSSDTFRNPPENWKLFVDAENHLSELAALGPDGQEFVAAYNQFQYIKERVKAMDTGYLETAAAQEGLDSPKIGKIVTGAIKDNYDKFSKAIREKDWATAGIYALGIYAIYKTMSKLKDTDGGGKALTWLTYGAAAYAGTIFLENAGYDVLSMAGFRNKDYMLKGTPLAVMKQVLQQQPGMQNVAEDLDYGIAMKMAEVNLNDLHSLYEESNQNGIRFIHPYQFSKIFPDLAGEWTFGKTMGQGGLKDYVGSSNENLKPGQRRYIETGKQIYNLAVAMQAIYEGTLMKDHPEYKAIPYEQIINDPTIKMGKVRHLLGAIAPYGIDRQKNGLVSSDKFEEARATMREAFGAEYGFKIDTQPNENGDYLGTLMDYPVVFVPVDGAYRIYLKSDYEGKLPGLKYIAELPIEGKNAPAEAQKAIKAVSARMGELLGYYKFAGNSLPIYQNGGWQADVTLPGVAEFDLNDSGSVAELVPDPDGNSVSVKLSNGIQITVDQEIAKLYPATAALLPSIIGQPEYRSLSVFAGAKQLKIVDPVANDGQITLLIGKDRKELELFYDPSTKTFLTIDEDKEKELIQSSGFSDGYVDALKENKSFELNVTAEKFKNLVKESAPEGVVTNFFGSLLEPNGPSPVKGFSNRFSGDVPGNFAAMVIETSKIEVMEKLRRRAQGAESFKELEVIRDEVLQDFNDKLKSIYDETVAKNNELKLKDDNWDPTLFSAMVIDQVRLASSESNAYSESRIDFEQMAYTLDLPGILDKSDANTSSHLAVEKLEAVYLYYTAHLDNPRFKGSKINLDTLSFPPEPTPVISDKTEDPALYPHYIVRYLEYVKNAVIQKAAGQADLDYIPVASAKSFWGIPSFEYWLESPEASFEPLDPMDKNPPYEHDPDRPDNLPTKLDDALMLAYRDAQTLLLKEYGDGLNAAEIERYFMNGCADDFCSTSEQFAEAGIFHAYISEDTGKQFAKYYKISDSINSSAKLMGNKRSTQNQLIQKNVQEFVEKVFTEKNTDGKYRFFTNKPGWTDGIRRKLPDWPWLRHLLPDED
jgi:hypothetical protein